MGAISVALTAQIKVELESQDVNFGALQDLKKLGNKMSSEWKRGNAEVVKMRSFASDAISSYKVARTKASQMLKIVADVEKQVKELGVEMPKAVVKMKQDAESTLKSGGTLIKELQSVRK